MKSIKPFLRHEKIGNYKKGIKYHTVILARTGTFMTREVVWRRKLALMGVTPKNPRKFVNISFRHRGKQQASAHYCSYITICESTKMCLRPGGIFFFSASSFLVNVHTVRIVIFKQTLFLQPLWSQRYSRIFGWNSDIKSIKKCQFAAVGLIVIDYCPTLFRITPRAIFICNQDAGYKISQLYWQQEAMESFAYLDINSYYSN